jgi:RNA polymerase sigma-70 factor, ECF subfamily
VSLTAYCDNIGELEVAALDETVNAGIPSEPDLPQVTQWALLVDRIRSGDRDAMDELYQVFSRGVRLYLCRQLGVQDVDDKVHDTFLIVVQAIQNGDLREPDRLMGFVRTIARRLVAGHIDTMVHKRRENVAVESGIVLSDQRGTPEQNVIHQQKVDVMLRVLGEMNARDRDVLTRFYLYEQSQDVICREMKLSATQFRLLKSRAKARFSELGRKTLESKNTLRSFSTFLHYGC